MGLYGRPPLSLAGFLVEVGSVFSIGYFKISDIGLVFSVNQPMSYSVS